MIRLAAVVSILLICAFLAGYWAGKTGPEQIPSEIILHELGVVQVAYGQTSAILPPPPEPIVRAPYIYIHGLNGSTVSVNVAFENGSPTLTEPEAIVTENSISWKDVTVAENGLIYQGESFPCLFYEGELAYNNPLQIEISSPDNYENSITFKVMNLGDRILKHIYIICQHYTWGTFEVYFEKLDPQEQQERPLSIYQVQLQGPEWIFYFGDNVVQTMVNEGICGSEARGFVREWIPYWCCMFPGISARAIYHIPSSTIEEMLPLDIQVPSGAELTSKRILWALIENIPLS